MIEKNGWTGEKMWTVGGTGPIGKRKQLKSRVPVLKVFSGTVKNKEKWVYHPLV